MFKSNFTSPKFEKFNKKIIENWLNPTCTIKKPRTPPLSSILFLQKCCWPCESSIWNLPNFDAAVFTPWRNNIIVVRTEGNIQDRTLVTGHEGVIRGNSSALNININQLYFYTSVICASSIFPVVFFSPCKYLISDKPVTNM